MSTITLILVTANVRVGVKHRTRYRRNFGLSFTDQIIVQFKPRMSKIAFVCSVLQLLSEGIVQQTIELKEAC
jgi:hypothetical protein